MSDPEGPDDFLRTGGALGGGFGDSAFAGDEELNDLIGSIVGSVRILERLGAGGMGDVYLGVDDRLDRKVAVKTLRQRFQLSSAAKQRFLREARILSRLDHPGICRLYDLVEADGLPCLLLEFVEGRTLGEVAGSLDESEVVRIATAIADALAAAHRSGVIHRDLKPENVMITSDGTVKVLDFGIGQLMEEVTGDSPEVMDWEEQSTGILERATVTGAIIGTPRYMSPEQARGEPVTPMSDLYSLGVMLIELISGHAPYTADGLAGLLVQVANAQVVPPDGVGPAVGRLIADLTGNDPEERPTAGETAERLRHIAEAPRRRRRRLVLGSITFTVAVAVVGALVVGQRLGEGHYKCRGFDQRLAGVWNSEVAERLGAAFEAVGAGGGWQLARAQLDAYSVAWVETAADACESTWVLGERTPELLDLTMACLDRRRGEIEALVDVLGKDPEAVADKVVQAVHALAPLDVCVNTQLLTAEVPLPAVETAREEANELREGLARVKALHDAGAYAEGAAAVQDLDQRVQALHHPPLTAEHSYLSALLAERLGAMDVALDYLDGAVLAGVAGRHDREVAKARIRTVWVRGVIMTDLEGARHEAAHARAAIQRISGDKELEGALVNHMAIVASVAGDDDTAVLRCFEALDLRRDAYGELHPKIASTMQNCAQMLQKLGRLEESLELGERAFSLRLQTLGPDHPAVFHSLESLTSTLQDMGREEEAGHYRQRAVELAAKVLPPGHPNLGLLKGNLANEALQAGDNVSAVRLAREAIEILSQAVDSGSVGTANVYLNLAQGLENLDEWDGAVEAGTQAALLYQRLFGDLHASAIHARFIVAHSIFGLGRHQEARELLEVMLETAGRVEITPWRLSMIRFRLAEALTSLGEEQRGRELLLQVAAVANDRDESWFQELAEETARLLGGAQENANGTSAVQTR